MVTVEFDSMGEAVRLALVAGEYVDGGLAVLLLDATDPRSDGYMAEWGVLTANVPAAAEWCRGRGNIAIDAAVPAELLEALEAAGLLRMAAHSAASGMARYPLATVAGRALDGVGGLPETLEEALGSTVVVEYESGGDAGAFEVGTAAAGSAELECLVARREVRGRRSGRRRRMGSRPGRVRGCRDHRLRDGADGLRDRGVIAPAATRTGIPATACPSRRFPGMDRAIPGPLRSKGPKAPWDPGYRSHLGTW